MNITNKVSELTGAHYGESHKRDVSLRVITDHIRSATFMICDGVLPSNEGRGYVLRRLLRRAARHGKLLGVNEPFLYKVVRHRYPRERGRTTPSCGRSRSYITKVIRTEEENFAKTIDGGMKHLSARCWPATRPRARRSSPAPTPSSCTTPIGFPIDLTAGDGGRAGHDRGRGRPSTSLMDAADASAPAKAREALGDLGWAGVEFGKDMPATAVRGL